MHNFLFVVEIIHIILLTILFYIEIYNLQIQLTEIRKKLKKFRKSAVFRRMEVDDGRRQGETKKFIPKDSRERERENDKD